MRRGIQGTLTKTSVSCYEAYATYFPNPLPPQLDPAEIEKSLERANRAVGELNGVVGAVPDPDIV